jgi:3-oxoacyl-[acyl-carrier protein] reductase
MRNVIVTGASRGLGLAIARGLTKAGYCSIAIARKETSQLTSAIREAEARSPGTFHFFPFDLAKIEDIAKLVTMLRKKFGPIYGLVNNAAVSHDGVLGLMHNSLIEQVVRLNTLSPIVLTKYVVRCMMADGGGRVVNIASIIANSGYSGLSVYGATKSSMIGFTRSLAREVGRAGVNVNSVAPGFMDTEMTQGIKEGDRERIVGRSALRRLVDIDDVANTVEFLLGDNAKNITGTVITVDAGTTA